MTNGSDRVYQDTLQYGPNDGLTKREYIATHIAAGLAADSEFVGNIGKTTVIITDNLIKSLNE